jgi:NitT/TauT family transport system permease protein
MRKWDIIVRFQNIPAPTEVGRAAVRLVQSPKLISHVRNSLMRIFAGFAIATVSAIPLGLLIGRFPLAGDALLTPLEVLRPIPAVAWIPLAILMFANAEGSMIYITFVGAFFPILLSTIHGVHSIDRRFVSAAMTLGAGPFTVFSEVILPGAMPSIVTGLSIGMGTSWFSLVTAEMISGQFGIGYYTWEAYTLQNYPDILLGMIAIGLLGMASSLLVKKAGGWFMPWFRPEGTET